MREPLRIGPDTLHGRAVLSRSVVHVADISTAQPYRNRVPLAVAAVELGGIRTMAFIPLLKDDAVIGLFIVYRQEVRPFSDKQIALLQNFAAQAVIAMENARLLTETREALEQQQAIAEFLQVINRSPGELQPVFDILLDKAMQLCGAASGTMFVNDDEQAGTVAARGVPAAYAEFRRDDPVSTRDPGSFAGRIFAGEPLVHTVDLMEDDRYRSGDRQRRAIVDLGGARTSLYVPLRRDRDVLGAIHIYRQEVRPFTDKQIALLQNFAAQAVIAMEPAMVFRADAAGRAGHRGEEQPGAGRRARPDLQRHYRAQTGRGPASRRPRCRGSDAARIEDRAGQPDPCRKDGLARPADRRHRARDQEPAQFRQ
jgi:GAF domain-containing protein